MVSCQIRVIYGDTDRMGVVYYANYLRFFEAGRNEFIRAQGTPYRLIEERGFRLPVVEAHLRYAAPALYDDLLVVETRVEELKRASLRFGYSIRRDGQPKPLCEGYTVHACLGADGRPSRIPEDLIELLGERGAAELP